MKNNFLPSKEKEKIFLVDDELDSLDTFKDSFDDHFTILKANSAEEALKMLKEHTDIAIVVADQRMPGMTGTELLAEIKCTYPLIVRVLLTGYADISAAIEAINQGTVYKYISKPYNPGETLKLLHEAVGYHHQIKEDLKLKNHTLRLIQEKTARAMEAYTGWIAHHVNNALQSVQTFMELVQPRFTKDDDEKDFAKTTAGYVRRIGDTIKMLIRIYAYGLERFVKTPLYVLVEFENEEIKAALKNKKITVKKEVRDRDYEIMADPMGIQEAVRKLVLNAVEASPEGSAVEVAAARFDDDGKESVLIQVKDRGKGMTPEIKEKIFFPFLKVTDAESIRGLGMPFVQAMVARHGGDVLVDSQPGKGTTVSFALPVIQPEPEDSLLDQKARAIMRRNQCL